MQLYTSIEIEQLQQDISTLMEINAWVKTFLGRPHRDLGRSGPVCPFVPQALKSDSIRSTVIRAKNLEPQQIEEIVLSYRDSFLELEPRDREVGINKVILLVFPDIHLDDTDKMIDAVQQKLKPFFVESGLMLGEFHNRTESPGLHNPNFRPLRSPIPLLAIRYMVEVDLPFLQGAEDLGLRVRYLEAYLRLFDKGGKDSVYLTNARRALALAKTQLPQESILASTPDISPTYVTEITVPVRPAGSCPFAHSR
ncbi:MAG: hypothetical protein PUP93_18200 [Rhizonema sp. NSF051]|nr:hypothetical protein [Rhizonema sp. NSF051]